MRKKTAHWKWFCPNCLVSGKARTKSECATCKYPGVVEISHKLHLPSPKASKTRWKEFFTATNFWNWGSNKSIKAKVYKTLGIKE